MYLLPPVVHLKFSQIWWISLFAGEFHLIDYLAKVFKEWESNGFIIIVVVIEYAIAVTGNIC